MTAIANAREKRVEFARRSAKAWQNYFDATGLLPNIHLSSEQISVVQQEENQMLINGSAGSGKSLTLLYKLLKVLEQEQEPKRILYGSFNTTLIEDARKKIRQSDKYHMYKERHTVHMKTFHNAAAEILSNVGFANAEFLRVSLENIKRNEELIIRRTIALVATFMESKEYAALPQEQKLYSTHAGTFLMDEISWMKANGFISEERYLNCERSGRGNTPRLTKEQRKTIYYLFQQYEKELKTKFNNHLDLEDYALLLLQYHDQIPDSLKYDYIFVDEVQDLQAMQLKSLVGLAKKSLVVSGDPKQRIYKRSPFSYRELGLHIEGRKNRSLKVNYRSTKQIMQLAASIQFTDEENDRSDSLVFVREGEKPAIRYFKKQGGLNQHIISSINHIRMKDPEASIAVIHRHDASQNDVNQCFVYKELNLNFDVIKAAEYGKRFDINQVRKPIFYTDAYSVKGLEFDYVFLIHFDKEHYPHQKRIADLEKRSGGVENAAYDADYDMIFNDEKKLLYVALTRAKKEAELLYTAPSPLRISQFIRDFNPEDYQAFDFKSSIYAKERK